MKSSSFHILRVGIAVTFLWVGVLIFKAPEAWGGYLQPWVANLLPFSLKEAMIGTALLDILTGFFLLIDVLTWLAALLGALHLIVVLTVSGITVITVRDIGLLAAVLALMVSSLPKKFSLKMMNKTKELYQCRECGLKYKEKEWANKCENWCRENKSCNLDIIKHSVGGNNQGA